VIGAVIILVIMFLIGPFAVFVGGALWSALIGWLYVASSEAPAADS
jgi:hypothetical protein